MIATRPDWHAFWREAWLDCNPPFYYAILSGWIRLFGDSNLMLRLPSVLFEIAAAILPVVWRPQGLNKSAAWTWAGLILLWPPGVLVMLDARGYALMILLSTASCLVFARLLDRLSLKVAFAWVALGTMMFLTHYFAAVLIAGQVLVLMYRHRTALFRIWPAAIVAIPGLGWFAVHLPRLKDYARPDVVWQDGTDAITGLADLLYVVGALNLMYFGLIAAIVIVAALYRKPSLAGADDPEAGADRNLSLVAAAAVIGFGFAMVIGVAHASLINRYLIPLVPPILLGLVLILQKSALQDVGCLLLTVIFLIPGLNPKTAESLVETRGVYGYERTSDFVGTYQAKKLVFVWDHPATKIMDQTSLKTIGGYFLKRSGVNIPVDALAVREGADPNTMLRIAADGPRPAILWLYDTGNRSAARHYPPAFDNDPDWTCRNERLVNGLHGEFGSIACVKLGSHK